MFKILNLILNQGGGTSILETIKDESLREFLSVCLHEDPGKRATVDSLIKHKFFEQTETDNDKIELDPKFDQLMIE